MRKAIILIAFILLSHECIAQEEGYRFIATETGKVISYFNQYFVVQVEGRISVTNQNNYTLYNIIMPLDTGTLTIVETTNTGIIRPDKLQIIKLEPQETVIIEYDIFGITGYNFTLPGMGFLQTALHSGRKTADSVLIMTIQKAPIETVSRDTGQIKEVQRRRIVSVEIMNPTSFTHNVSYVDVIKTPAEDPNNELIRWRFPLANESEIVIGPQGKWRHDIADYNSTEGEVYWLSSRIILDFLLYTDYQHNISWFTQDDLIDPANTTSWERGNVTNISDFLEHFMYFRKETSKTVVMPGDEIKVILNVHNFAPVSRMITVMDSWPRGFTLSDATDGNTKDSTISWSREVNPDSVLGLSYTLKFIDNESLGLDYFEPANLTYENNTIPSKRIPFIRQYIPATKVYVQKKLSYSLNDEIMVNLKVQNLGQGDITDLFVMEHLSQNDVFREMTQLPESKGVWKIPVIKKGQDWEVTYITNENNAVNLLPDIFGVENQLVMKTLVFENIIRNEWVSTTIKLMEYVGILFVLLFPIAAFVYFRRKRIMKEWHIRMLKRHVEKLKDETNPPPNVKIDVLKRESSSGKIPDIDPSLKTRPRTPARAMAHENLEKLRKLQR